MFENLDEVVKNHAKSTDLIKYSTSDGVTLGILTAILLFHNNQYVH